jgi:hypothetical protein
VREKAHSNKGGREKTMPPPDILDENNETLIK